MWTAELAFSHAKIFKHGHEDSFKPKVPCICGEYWRETIHMSYKGSHFEGRGHKIYVT